MTLAFPRSIALLLVFASSVAAYAEPQPGVARAPRPEATGEPATTTTAATTAATTATTTPTTKTTAAAAAIDELLELSGMNRQVQPVAGGLADEFLAKAPAPELPGIEVLLAGAARTEFAAALLLKDIRQSLLDHYDAGAMIAVRRWLTSPPGRRLTALEEQAATAVTPERLTAYAQRMATEPPPPDRVALLQELDRSMKISEQSHTMILGMARAAAQAFNAISPSPKSESQVDAELEAARPKMEGAFADTIFLSLILTYERATEADLSAYAEFAKTPDGRWYTESMMNALIVALGNATDRMARSVARDIQPAAKSAR